MSDPFGAYTSVLLHFDGVDGSAEILNSGKFTGPKFASVGATLSTSDSKFGGVSLRVGASGYVQADDPVNSSIAGATDKLTVEFWTKRLTAATSTGTIVAFASGSTRYSFYWRSTSRFAAYDGANMIFESSNTVALNTWYHYAFVKDGSAVRLYVDGVLRASGTNTVSRDCSAIVLGRNEQGGEIYDGYIDELRITKGVARYSSDFTPQTQAYPDTTFDTLSLDAALRVGELMPLNPTTTLPNQPVVFLFDPERGTATLTGTTKNLGSPNQPVSRRVQLIEEVSGRVLREVWSDPVTGVYTFSEIKPQIKFSVVAYDHTGVFRAVIADNLEATP